MRHKPATRDVIKQPSRKGDRDYIKRPENAFMLFRRQKCKEHRVAQGYADPKKKFRQADLSKLISQQWKTLLPEEKQCWIALAQTKKAWHERTYPDYVYRPRPRKTKEAGRDKGDNSRNAEAKFFCFPLVGPLPGDSKEFAPTHPSDYSGCGALGLKPRPKSGAEDLITISTFRSHIDQAPMMQRNPEPVVGTRHSSDDFFPQSSSLDDLDFLVSLGHSLLSHDHFTDHDWSVADQ